MTNLIGQSLGRYHILEQLGEGGMAIVYKAYDTRLERDVAVKVIRRGAFPPDQLEHMLKRFEREAKSLAKLSHPNIVKVLDFGEHEDAPYLVMEYFPGGTLKQRLGKPIPWQDAVHLLLPVAQALEYAHEHNIIHRDIKPANILLTEKGQPMLTDFGIAKILETNEAATLTGTGVGVGTPEYMAPEQWTGQTTSQSDIYSLGVVLYEMVTGRKPYTADTPAAILLKQANDPLPRPSQFARDLPEKVEKILWKALAKEPADRYVSMGDLAKALESLLSVTIGVEKKDPMPQPKRPQDAIRRVMLVLEKLTMGGLAAPPAHVAQKFTPPAASFLKRYRLGIISVLTVVGLCIAGVFLVRSYDGLALFPTYTSTLTYTPAATYTPVATLTHTPAATYTPVAALTPSKTATSIKSPTATLSLLPLGEWTISISASLNNPYFTQFFKIDIREGGILIRDGVMYSNNRGKMTVNNIGEVQGSWTLEGDQVTLIFAENNWIGILDGKMIIGINRIGDHGGWSAVYNDK